MQPFLIHAKINAHSRRHSLIEGSIDLSLDLPPPIASGVREAKLEALHMQIATPLQIEHFHLQSRNLGAVCLCIQLTDSLICYAPQLQTLTIGMDFPLTWSSDAMSSLVL
jgi:hypothetical protein